MHWRGVLFVFALFHLPGFAAETFCYDTPGNSADQPVIVAGQRIYGQHTARIAGWVLQQLPQATFIHLPWQRCLSQVREGRISGILSIGWTAERAKSYQFPLADGKPDPAMALYEVPYHIYVHRDSKVQWDGQRFIGLQYGLITFKGYLTEQRLRELNALSPLDLDIHQAVDLVLKHRIDGYVIPPGTTYQQFSQHSGFSKVRQLQPPLLTIPLYLAFSTKYCQDHSQSCLQVWQHLATQRQLWEQAQAAKAQ